MEKSKNLAWVVEFLLITDDQSLMICKVVFDSCAWSESHAGISGILKGCGCLMIVMPRSRTRDTDLVVSEANISE